MQSWITPYVVWCMTRNGGKALSLDTRIPTPFEDCIMEDIHVGSFVLDEEEKPCRVVYESPVYIGHDCFAVSFEDGERIIADAEHNWFVCMDGHRDKVCTTAEMYGDYVNRSAYGNTYKYSVQVCGFRSDRKYVTEIKRVDSVPVKCI